MIFIAHRGNFRGPNPTRENRMDHILGALDKGYHVEIDVWYENKQWWLGHDKPTYKTGTSIFQNPSVWCHAKNTDALNEFKKLKRVHYFWHDKDDYTLTSSGIVWCRVGSPLIKDSVCVLPENGFFGDIKKCRAICSDFDEFLHKK